MGHVTWRPPTCEQRGSERRGGSRKEGSGASDLLSIDQPQAGDDLAAGMGMAGFVGLGRGPLVTHGGVGTGMANMKVGEDSQHKAQQAKLDILSLYGSMPAPAMAPVNPMSGMQAMPGMAPMPGFGMPGMGAAPMGTPGMGMVWRQG